MTLIVGIRCSDGVVIGADGAATLGSMGNMTAQQKTVRKLSILQGKIIAGVAGSVGIGQRLRAVLEEEYKAGKYKSVTVEKAMTAMRTAFYNEVVGEEWRCARETVSVVGPQVALTSASNAMVTAIPISGKAQLIQFDHQCAPEMATDDLPFIAIGSGQMIADPFLAFVRRVFWPAGCPTLSDGTFSTVWTLRHAIDTIPGGVADPIQVAILERTKGEWSARELDAAEIEQHVEAIKDAEQSLKDWRSRLSGSTPDASPEKPPI